MYGVHLTPVKDLDGDDVQVGVYYGGILVYRNFLRLVRFSWPKIIKISFLRNRFIVRRRPTEGEASEVDEVFKLADYKRAKRLWKLAVDHHTFFRMREPEAPPRPRFMPRVGTLNRSSTRTRTHYQLVNADQPDRDDRTKRPTQYSSGTGSSNWGTLPDVDHRQQRAHPDGLGNEQLTDETLAPSRTQTLNAAPRHNVAPDDDEMRHRPTTRTSPQGADSGLFGVPPPPLVPAVREALRAAANPPDYAAPNTPLSAVTTPQPDTLGGRTNFTHGCFAIEHGERFVGRKTLVRACTLPRDVVNGYLRARMSETDLDDDAHDRALEQAILSVTGVDPHASVIDHHRQAPY